MGQCWFLDITRRILVLLQLGYNHSLVILYGYYYIVWTTKLEPSDFGLRNKAIRIDTLSGGATGSCELHQTGGFVRGLRSPNFQIVELYTAKVLQEQDLLAGDPKPWEGQQKGSQQKSSKKLEEIPRYFPPQGERHALASHFTKQLARHPVVPLALNPRPRRPLGRVNHQRCGHHQGHRICGKRASMGCMLPVAWYLLHLTACKFGYFRLGWLYTEIRMRKIMFVRSPNSVENKLGPSRISKPQWYQSEQVLLPADSTTRFCCVKLGHCCRFHGMSRGAILSVNPTDHMKQLGGNWVILETPKGLWYLIRNCESFNFMAIKSLCFMMVGYLNLLNDVQSVGAS